MAVSVTGDITYTTPVTIVEGQNAAIPLTWAGNVGAGTVATPDSNLTYATVDGTAKAPYDYTSTTGTISWTGTTGATASITVPTIDDTTDEAEPESFTVNIFDPDASTTVPIETVTVNVSDNDNGPTYTMAANKTTVVEGTDTQVTVTVTLGAASEQNVTIPIATEDATAKAGSDYTLYSTPLVFTPGQTVKTFNVALTNDTTDEDDQTFKIKASAGTNVTGVADPITITIQDEDAAPTVSFTGPSTTVTEGGDLNLPVSLSAASDKTVTVKYDTSDYASGDQPVGEGMATAGKDYTAVAAGTVTFAPGDTSKNAVVKTTADDLDEITPEDFRATLSAPNNATLGATTTTIGKIADPGSTTSPTVTLSPKSVTEGNTGTFVAQTFTVTLSKASGKTQIVHWAASKAGPDTTTADVDFKLASGDLTFAPGDLSKTFTVDVMGDKIDEVDETFTITLGNGAGATLSSATGDLKANPVTITDDDAKPTFTVNNVSTPEGNNASVALYTVALSNPTSTALTWSAVQTDDTAKSNATGNPATAFGTDDYAVPVGTFSIPAGQTNGYAFVLVNGDAIYEGDETASIKFTPTVGGSAVTGTSATGQLILKNDDTAPVLEVLPASGKEGDSIAVKGVITGQSQTPLSFTIGYMGKAIGSAKAASADDFVNPGAKVVDVVAGTAIGTQLDLGTLKVNTDTVKEGPETIEVSGFGLGNVGTVKPGVVTIAGDDGSLPTEPGEPGTGAVTISAPKNIVGAVTVTIEGKAPADSPVDLWAAPMGGGGELKKILSTKSDKDGHYSFDRWIGEGYRFAAASGKDQSDEVMVTVTQNPVFVASSPSKGMLSLAVQGNPRGPGQTVIVQRAMSGKWVNAWRGTTGSDNIWRGSAKLASGTVVTVRAFVAGYTPDGLAPGYTAAKKIIIK
ncbi:Calx-beta domain-containing protein [Actinoplanes sp. NPDC051513]|uniref:Calx-beta domain-containing protein n=1 Tax=Actinoplanes sp. NPDC051513 TaxID=3363908 RepID=UPI0037AC33C3